MKKQWRKRWIAGLMAVVMLFAAGCSSGGGSSETSAAATDAQTAVDETSASLEASGRAPKNGDHYVIGCSLMSLGIDYFVCMMQTMQRACDAKGYELNLVHADSDAARQYDQVMDFIQKDVDAIIVGPLDSDGIIGAVEAANEADIPVFCIDTYANGGDFVEAVNTDNYGMGVEAAHQIAARLTERYGEPRGKVFNLIMSLKFSSGVARDQGFKDTIEAEYPDIEIVLEMDASVQNSTGIDAGMNCTLDALQQLPEGELDAMWCHNDNNVIGAIRAMEQVGRLYPADDERHIIIYGVDGQENVYEMIVEGSVDGMIMQQPGGMSRYIIDSVEAYLTEGTRPAEADRITFYPYKAITHWNYNSEEITSEPLWFEEIEK